MTKAISALLLAALIGLISAMAASADATEEQMPVSIVASEEGQMPVSIVASEEGQMPVSMGASDEGQKHGLSTACSHPVVAVMNPNCGFREK